MRCFIISFQKRSWYRQPGDILLLSFYHRSWICRHRKIWYHQTSGSRHVSSKLFQMNPKQGLSITWSSIGCKDCVDSRAVATFGPSFTPNGPSILSTRLEPFQYISVGAIWREKLPILTSMRPLGFAVVVVLAEYPLSTERQSYLPPWVAGVTGSILLPLSVSMAVGGRIQWPFERARLWRPFDAIANRLYLFVWLQSLDDYGDNVLHR